MPRATPAAGPSLLPFAVVAMLGLVLVAVPFEATRWLEFSIGLGVTALVGVLAVWSGGQRLPDYVQAVPALLYLVSVALLRDSVGGAAGGVGILGLLPVIWTALHGTRRQLGIVVAGLAVVWTFPLVAIGGVAYPAQGWRAALLLVCVSAVLGHVLQRLVSRTRADAAERAALVDRLEELAGTDHLTGLPNRRGWTAALTDTLAEIALAGAPVSVALLDFDGLKAVNDREGHAAGDALLRTAAARWRAELGSRDMLARLGGDEFALLLPRRSLEEAVEMVERLRASMPGSETCSAGVAEGGVGEGSSDLVGRADAALYAAKRAGGDRTFAGPMPVRSRELARVVSAV